MRLTNAELPHMTAGEFLRWAEAVHDRVELVCGRAVTTATKTDRQSILQSRLGIQLGAKLRRPCEVRSEAGIYLPHDESSFFIADLAVSCAPVSDRPGIPDPVLIVEILSESTIEHDRGRKLAEYRLIPSVREILLVFSDRRRVEVWQRRDEGWWTRDMVASALIPLETVDAALDMAALYDGLGLDANDGRAAESA